MRLTTDTPKNNLEMALNLFYVKDKEVWVRGYGKNGADISLFDLSRDLTRWNCPYVDLDISDDSFSMMMAEWLWEDVESFEHILALLYQAAWVCAELREHLKQFEDTGLYPESVEALKLSMMGKAISEITEFDGLPIDRLRELAEADKDGRVVVLPPEKRTLDFPAKYTEIRALYHFCVDLGIKCTIEHLYDGYAVRFPDGSDFAQHHGTYGGTEGCVEPAIGDSEFDYTAVGLNLAKELVKKHKGKLEADHA